MGGEVPKKDPKKPDKVVVAGKKEASQYSPSKQSKINDLTVTLKLDLGGNVWIIGAIDKETLLMFKIRFTGANEISVLSKLEDKKFDKDKCGTQKSFNEDCFKGEVPKKDPNKPDKVEVPGEKEASQYSPSKQSKI